MKNILIIGATSAIAEATARIYAQRGDNLYLIARNRERLETIAKDLKVRGATTVTTATFDADHFVKHQKIVEAAIKALDGVDIVLIAHGDLPNQKTCETSFDATLAALNTNAISVISLLTHLANHFEQQGHGTIAVLSSVAGDRGRKSIYVYGAAKAAINSFLQGLRQRLHKAKVNVLTIKPGFVDTPMTADIPKGMLFAQPGKVASDIVNAIDKRKHTLYTPSFWRVIMLIIKSMPERLFVQTSF